MRHRHLGLLAAALAATLACSPSPPPAPTPQPPAAAAQPSPAVAPSPPATARKQYTAPPAMTINPQRQYSALLRTSEGDIRIQLLPEDAPMTVNNFVFLARERFYDGVRFHRIIKGFMVQTGDPQGTGAGGPGYRFADEPVKKEYAPGTVAMANAGPNTNGSQFFLMHGDYTGRLPKNYTIFGRITQGMEILEKIANTPVRPGPSGENSTPIKEVTITSVEVTEQ